MHLLPVTFSQPKCPQVVKKCPDRLNFENLNPCCNCVTHLFIWANMPILCKNARVKDFRTDSLIVLISIFEKMNYVLKIEHTFITKPTFSTTNHKFHFSEITLLKMLSNILQWCVFLSKKKLPIILLEIILEVILKIPSQKIGNFKNGFRFVNPFQMI